MEGTGQDEYPKTIGEELHISAETWAGIIIALGFMLVLFAGSIGAAFVTKHYYGANRFSFSPEEVKSIAEVTRMLGCMVFALGLVKWIVAAIREAGRAQAAPRPSDSLGGRPMPPGDA